MSESGARAEDGADLGALAGRFCAALAARDERALAELLHPSAVWNRGPAGPVTGRDRILSAWRDAATTVTLDGPLRVTRGREVAWTSRESAAEDVATGNAEPTGSPRVDVVAFDEGLVLEWLTIGGCHASASTSGPQVAALEAYVARVGRGDSAGALALFGASCDVEDPVGTPVHRGRAAVENFYNSGLSAITGTRLLGPAVSSGAVAAVPFRVELDLGDRAIALEVIDVMTFDQDGLFSSMRAFWGRGNRHSL